MSPRFWLFSMASAGAALAGGLGLGLYATTPPRVALSYDAPLLSAEPSDAATPDPAELRGPTEIHCIGCGPTLAQRQMAAMMTGGWDGYDDPVVRDYEAQDHAPPDDPLPYGTDALPSPIHQLPANIDRFATGGNTLDPPVQLVQGTTRDTSRIAGDNREQLFP